ncbi:MAG: YoaK family protein [Thermoleophilia bacterium]
MPAPAADERPALAALVALTAVTGLVDAASFLGLGQIFTANMTGNVVLLGFALGGADGFSIPALLTSIGAFVVGAAAGGRAGVLMAGRPRGRWLTAAVGAEVLLVAGAAVVALGLDPDPEGPRRYAMICLLGLGMGVRNATVRRMGVPGISTTVLTSTLTGLAADPRHRGRGLAAVGAMLGGAVVGALLIQESLALPLLVAAAVTVVPLLVLRRQRAG